MNKPELITVSDWKDYELIDTGGFEKLERFGGVVTVRPEPQAMWLKRLPEEEWMDKADAVFRKTGQGNGNGSRIADERGTWNLKKGTPEQWKINYGYKDMSLSMRLGFTSFKHVGIFPEQAANWKYIYDRVMEISEISEEAPQVLNLFAYTGGASLAAAAAGAEVTHVDSVKQVVTWARENMDASGLDGIRWMVDDALKFIRREVRRGKRYQGIILDPPAYGRGPDGEKWVLEESLSMLMSHCRELLDPENSFIVLNLYSMGLSPLLANTIAGDSLQGFFENGQGSFGELYMEDRSGRKLPFGIFCRYSTQL